MHDFSVTMYIVIGYMVFFVQRNKTMCTKPNITSSEFDIFIRNVSYLNFIICDFTEFYIIKKN